MSRTYRLYLNDILTAIETIERFIAGHNLDSFSGDELRLHGVLYNMMTIGEAVKNLPQELPKKRRKAPSFSYGDIRRSILLSASKCLT